MKICIIGNCQTVPLRQLLRARGTDLQCELLPSVYMMQEQHRDLVAAAIGQADWVIGQLVTDEYPVPFVRTSALRAQAGDRLIVWPNAYFSGYAPEYHTIIDPVYQNFLGPMLEYHNEKIILGFFLGLGVDRTVQLLSTATALDDAWYGSAVDTSLQSLKERETRTDVTISDFIEDNFAERRLFYIMNHPTIDVLGALASRILDRMAMPYVADVPSSLFMDSELVEPFYPENMFIRERCKFSFPSMRLYRGVNLAPADTVLGVQADGPRIYTESAMVEAMFTFYRRHEQPLREHPRVRAILDRARPALA